MEAKRRLNAGLLCRLSRGLEISGQTVESGIPNHSIAFSAWQKRYAFHDTPLQYSISPHLIRAI